MTDDCTPQRTSGDRTPQETITVTVQPEAAMGWINSQEWDEADLDFIRALAGCVESGEPLSWEVPRDAV